MSSTRYTDRERRRFEARTRFYQNLHTCEHVWEHRPWDVFEHRCAKCGAWSKGGNPPPVGRKREVSRG